MIVRRRFFAGTRLCTAVILLCWRDSGRDGHRDDIDEKQFGFQTTVRGETRVKASLLNAPAGD